METTNDKWQPEGFGNFGGYQRREPLRSVNDDEGPSNAKRAKVESDSSEDEGENEENYSPPSSVNLADISNPYNGPGPLAHSTPIVAAAAQGPPPQPANNHQQMPMQQQFDHFLNPMNVAAMDPLMQQQWVAHQYQILQHQQQQQQQHQAYAIQNIQQPQMYNLVGINNTHTSGSSEDDSGNSSSFLTPDLDKPANQVLFCQVPGRLALLSSNKKVRVSLAEIKRRINAPECLNSSLLSAILRKAKNKEGGKTLANELSKYNISLPAGRRKAAPNTAFTALVEAEALTLAKDFADLSDKHFPYNDIAYEFIKYITTIEEWHASMMVVHNYVIPPFGVLQRLMTILSCDKSPVVDSPLEQPTMMNPESQKNFTHYSLLTHGFGVPGIHTGWNVQYKIFKVLYEAMTNPRQFCTKLARPIPDAIAAIEPVILMSHQQQHQHNQAALLQQQQQQPVAYPVQMQQQQQSQQQVIQDHKIYNYPQ